MKEAFDATIRVKVPRSVRARFERIAAAKVKQVPELAREALVTFIEQNRHLDPEEVNGHGAAQPEEVQNGSGS